MALTKSLGGFGDVMVKCLGKNEMISKLAENDAILTLTVGINNCFADDYTNNIFLKRIPEQAGHLFM